MAIRIAFVDDSKVNRNTFAQKVQLFDDLEIVFNSADGDDCLRSLKESPPGKLPQVLFVDLEMAPPNGIQVIQVAKVLYPWMFFIVLTVFDDEEKIFEAIQAGADGYLMKDENAIELRNAITNCLEQGGAPMSPAIARKALELLSRSDAPVAKASASLSLINERLSDREKEILQQIVNGLSPKQIAEQLWISVFTVRKHIANIYGKLHVNNNSQILALAHKKSK
ncbi:MAG TPA: response regulator transcription factor [Chitinophagaceae bacterium]|nr:response regulator transcription factor [Chitinophagaceae bacterium]